MIHFFTADCATPKYTKDDGSLVCGFSVLSALGWEEANEYCIGMGGRLPVINSERENDKIRVREPHQSELILTLPTVT